MREMVRAMVLGGRAGLVGGVGGVFGWVFVWDVGCELWGDARRGVRKQ